MNRTHIIKTTTGEFIPELIINGKDIIKAGFTPGAVFKIEQYRDGLVITLPSMRQRLSGYYWKWTLILILAQIG